MIDRRTFLQLYSWREAGVLNADQLKAMTLTAAELMSLSDDRTLMSWVVIGS